MLRLSRASGPPRLPRVTLVRPYATIHQKKCPTPALNPTHSAAPTCITDSFAGIPVAMGGRSSRGMPRAPPRFLVPQLDDRFAWRRSMREPRRSARRAPARDREASCPLSATCAWHTPARSAVSSSGSRAPEAASTPRSKPTRPSHISSNDAGAVSRCRSRARNLPVQHATSRTFVIRYSKTGPRRAALQLMARRAGIRSARSPAARASTLVSYSAAISSAVELLTTT